MDFRYTRVSAPGGSAFRDNNCHCLTQAFRSATIWVASWAVLVIGFCTQRQSRRSITPKSLWARGFGKTSSDQILNFQQPKEVRFLS